MAVITGSSYLLPFIGAADNAIEGDSTLQSFISGGEVAVGVGIEGACQPERFTCSGHMHAPVALEALTLSATMLTGEVASAAITLEAFDARGESISGAIRLEEFSVSGVLPVGGLLEGAVSLARFTASGRALQDGESVGDWSLQPFSAIGVMASSGVPAGEIHLRPLALHGTLIPGAVGRGSITLDLFEVDGAGYADGIGTAAISLPFLTADGLMTGDATPVTTSVVVNTRNHAVSRYDHNGEALNSMCSFQGVMLAAGPSGVVAMIGADDDGDPIAAYIEGGTTDFGSPMLKRVVSGYLSYRATGSLLLTLTTDEDRVYTYTVEPRQYDNLHPTHVKFGRGVEGRFWSWRLENEAGSGFELNDFLPVIEESSRRV